MKLFFALDGTLFQTEKTVLTTARAFFSHVGLPYPGDGEILSHVGRPMNIFMKNILGSQDEVPESTVQLFRSIEHGSIQKNGRLFDGTEDMLRRLKEGAHALYVCSNGSVEYIELVLTSMGVREYFDGVYSAKLALSKADRLCELLCGDKNAVFIGDTFDDLLAARQNGLAFIAALYGYGGDGALDELAYRAALPGDIVGILGRITAAML
jgi:phosphoglycolate phosphatase-like HAD superfamily hydrolase